MLAIMCDYYSNMKEDIGINPNQNDDEDDPELDQVLQDMKSNSTAVNFREFLARSQNFDRNTPWKQISRRVCDNDKKKRIRSSAGQTSLLVNNSNLSR